MPIEKKRPREEGDDDSQGGKTGRVEFSGVLTGLTDQRRDDAVPLSEPEIRQLLVEHEKRHAEQVEKQREEQKARELQQKDPSKKEEYSLGQGGLGYGGGADSGFPPHPVLAEAAQFSGMDKQVTAAPADHKAETNAEIQQELANRLQLGFKLQHQPKLSAAPTLRRT